MADVIFGDLNGQNSPVFQGYSEVKNPSGITPGTGFEWLNQSTGQYAVSRMVNGIYTTLEGLAPGDVQGALAFLGAGQYAYSPQHSASDTMQYQRDSAYLAAHPLPSLRVMDANDTAFIPNSGASKDMVQRLRNLLLRVAPSQVTPAGTQYQDLIGPTMAPRNGVQDIGFDPAAKADVVYSPSSGMYAYDRQALIPGGVSAPGVGQTASQVPLGASVAGSGLAGAVPLAVGLLGAWWLMGA